MFPNRSAKLILSYPHTLFIIKGIFFNWKWTKSMVVNIILKTPINLKVILSSSKYLNVKLLKFNYYPYIYHLLYFNFLMMLLYNLDSIQNLNQCMS